MPPVANSTKSKSRRRAPSSEKLRESLLVLEPRILFDAAAVATGAEVATDQVAQDQADAAVNPEGGQAATSPEADEQDALLQAIASVEPASNRREIVFVDTGVEDYQTLIAGLDPDRTPARVRLRLSARQGAAAEIGAWVELRAVLRPPSPPVAPGAFDFQRHAYFQRLGGVGFAVTVARRTAPPGEVQASVFAPWRLALAGLRIEIADRIRAALDGPAGAVAAALMTGDRRAIPAHVLADMRDSGLAHLLAISGLHVGLVAAILFFGLRAALALVPKVALRYPIKKWAAAAALVGAFGYVLISGASVSTQRAFLMVGVVLLAVMVDRTAISMRLVAWAALIVLAMAPESLLGPSFQMSFAAVVALVAAYEVLRRRLSAWRAEAGTLRRAGLYLVGVGITTIVATAATAPFAVYHFNRFAEYGLAANLAAVPLTALWVMPWAMAAFCLMPAGLEAVALTPMGWASRR